MTKSAMTRSAHKRRGPSPLAALRHRNFRLYFMGHSISILGTWIQQVALSWLTYRITGSVDLLGLTAFLALAPQLVVGPLAGAIIDRLNRRRLLMVLQTLMAVQALTLAGLTVSGLMTAPLLIAMALLTGVLTGFDTATRQTLIASLLEDRTDIRNALAINAMVFNLGRFIGPPIAGLLLAATSEAVCFALNAASFLTLLTALVFVRSTQSPSRSGQSYLRALGQGFQQAWQDRPSRLLLMMVASINLTASSYAVLMPVFAKDVFLGDARTLGLLIGAAGCGALLSSVFLTVIRNLWAIVVTMGLSSLTAAVAMITFATIPPLSVALVAMVGVGFGISLVNVSSNATIQSITPDHLRGRVTSLYLAIRFGLDALGGLIAGYAAAHFGVARTFQIEGVLLLLAALCVAPLLRRLCGAITRREDAMAGP